MIVEETLVSIVLPIYNCEKYISMAVESIINQTYKNWELIIIDDGSTDHSSLILQEYEKKDSRIKLHRNEENAGLPLALNKAISLSSGDLLARMDADDISLPIRIEKQVAYLKKHIDIDILGSFAIDIDSNNHPIRKRKAPVFHEDILKMMLLVNPMIHPSVMYRRKIETLKYNDLLKNGVEDYDLWFRAMGTYLQFHNLPEFLLFYRVDNDYLNRRSLKYRIVDFKVKKNGFKILKVPYYKYIYLFLPLLVGLIPKYLYNWVKKFDPRM